MPPQQISQDVALYDLLPEVLDETFSFHFSFIAQHPEHQRDKRLFGPSPFMFYDRHIYESQRLKHVASLPSLIDDVTRKVDQCLEGLRKRGEGPLPVWYQTQADFSPLLKDSARDIENEDEEITSYDLKDRTHSLLSLRCLPLVSSWIVHPRAPKYYSAVEIYIIGAAERPPVGPSFPCEEFKIRFISPDDVHADVLNSVDDTIKGALADWHNRDLVTWVFLPLSPDSEQLLRDLDRLVDNLRSHVLPSPRCPTQGFPVSPKRAPQSTDGRNTPWILQVADLGTNHTDSDLVQTSSRGGVIYPRSLDPTPRSAFQSMQCPTPEGLAHHVWRLAVQEDTTVIVVNCGNYERIGVRHRASQTLYLSDMIDLTKPGYGKIHLGILMSAVDDALDRYRAYCERNPSIKSRKRPPPKTEARRSKRQKLNLLLERSRDHPPLNRRDCKTFWREIENRPLLLLRFCGRLNSSAPSCILRTGGPLSSSSLSPYTQGSADRDYNTVGRSYKASEYFLLTLDWESSNGVTGQVFPGRLQVTLSSGRKLQRNVVAKIAYFPAAQERVRREYQVYQELWSHEVKRIPEIYGLFEDIDNMATILVMERAAYTFRQREPFTKANEGLLKEVPASEKLTCKAIVKAIHNTGIVHRDIRAENLVIAQDGKPMVIDFDRAVSNAPDDWKERETKAVEDLLSGKRFFRF